MPLLRGLCRLMSPVRSGFAQYWASVRWKLEWAAQLLLRNSHSSDSGQTDGKIESSYRLEYRLAPHVARLWLPKTSVPVVCYGNWWRTWMVRLACRSYSASLIQVWYNLWLELVAPSLLFLPSHPPLSPPSPPPLHSSPFPSVAVSPVSWVSPNMPLDLQGWPFVFCTSTFVVAISDSGYNGHCTKVVSTHQDGRQGDTSANSSQLLPSCFVVMWLRGRIQTIEWFLASPIVSARWIIFASRL